jgi:ribose 5-phosphate isomerase B
MRKNIAIASDRAGVEMKSFLMEHSSMEERQLVFIDLGVNGDVTVDYPDYARKVVDAILGGKADLGVLICGTGIGMSMAANRFRGIRAALCHHSLEAKLAREHNNANILCMGARMLGNECALENLRVFLDTEFAGGRHAARVDKLDL